MSQLINRLSGQSDEPEPAPPRAQQLELLGPLPISVKDPPSITAPIPPRNNALTRGRNKSQAEPILSPPAESDQLHAALADAHVRMEALRLEIVSLQDSRDSERKSRLAGEQRIRELEEQLRAASEGGRPEVASMETRQALDEAQTQLDDLRSQFRHLEGNHGAQANKHEQRVKELTLALDQEKKESQAARMEIERLAIEAEAAQKAEGIEEELIQVRMRVDELETRLCAEAETRGRAERHAGELQVRLDDVLRETEQRFQDQARQAETIESRIGEAEQQVRQAISERDEALGLAQQAHTLRAQEAARFQERERLSAQRMSALRRVDSPVSAHLPTRALSALPVPWPLFLVLILVVAGGAFLLGRWQGGTIQRQDVERSNVESLSPEPDPAFIPRPVATKPVQWPTIKGNFIRVQTATGRMTMVFEYAVFSRRTEIHPDALRDLQKLARQLAPLTGTFQLEITGHTDADPVSSKAGEYANNLDLGLKRAQAVREVLIRQGGLPPGSMTTVSAGESNPPYPNTTPELRKKNRTVTFALIPK